MKKKRKKKREKIHFQVLFLKKKFEKKKNTILIYFYLGFVDPITLEEVVKPAISPYGHVMRYDYYYHCSIMK